MEIKKEAKLTLWVSEGPSAVDVVINPHFFQINKGEVVRIGGKLLYRYDGEQGSMPATLQLQVSALVARTFGWMHRDRVLVEKIGQPHPPDIQITHVELLFGSQYLGRADQFQLALSLAGHAVFQNQIVSLPNTHIRCRIDRIYASVSSSNTSASNASFITYESSRDTSVSSGIINSQTQFVFRSESCKQYILIQVSKEMFEFDDDGTMYFERCVHVFFPSLFQKWEERRTSHSISLVMFGRTRYDQSELNEVSEPVIRDEDGQGGYKDFYKVVVDLDSNWDQETILLKVMKEFVEFRRVAIMEMAAKFEGDARMVGRLTYAYESPFLEPVNLVFNAFDKHYIDRDLSKTGLSVVVITAGSGFFKVDKRLLRITIERAMYLGLGVDLISLSKKPLHSVPLLLFMSSHPQTFLQNPLAHLTMTTHRSPSSALLHTLQHSHPSSSMIWDQGDSSDPLYFDHPSGPSAEIESFYVQPVWVDCSFFAKQFDKPFRVDRFIPRARVGEIAMMGVTPHQPILLPLLDLKITEDGSETKLQGVLWEMSERALEFSSEDDATPMHLDPEDSDTESMLGAVASGVRKNEFGPSSFIDVSDQWFHATNAQKRDMLWEAYDAQVFAPPVRDTNGGTQEATFAGSSYSTGDDSPFRFGSNNNSSPRGPLSNEEESSSSFDGPAHVKRQRLKDPEPIRATQHLSPQIAVGGEFTRGRSKDVIPTLVRSETPELHNGKGDEKDRSPTPVGRLNPHDPRNLNQTSIRSQVASRSTSATSTRSAHTFTSSTLTNRTTPTPTTVRERDRDISSTATTKTATPLLISRFMAGPSAARTTANTFPKNFGAPIKIGKGRATKAKATTEVTMTDTLKQLESMEFSGIRKRKSTLSEAEETPINVQEQKLEPMETSRPFNPSKSSKKPEGAQARDRRRWQNVFPKSFTDLRSIKWRSIATPACLPLVSDYIPSQEEQNFFYTSETYQIQLRDSSLMLKDEDIKKSKPWALIMEMMRQRLAQGFQIISKAYRQRGRKRYEYAEADKYKTISEIITDLERGRTASVYLSLSNQIHKITYIQGTAYVQVEILTRKRTWATDHFSYSFSISNASEYTAERTYFSYPSLINPTDWEYLDDILSGNETNPSLRDSMKYWRMRCVILPTNQSEEKREALLEHGSQLDANATDEDIRLAGMSRLFSIFHEARWAPPGMSVDDDPISLDFTTLEPPIYALFEAGQSRRRQFFANVRRLQGMSLDALAKLMCDPVSGVELRNRNWWNRSHQDVFVGHHFVTWLVKTFSDIPTREKAIESGEMLRAHGLFEHCSNHTRALLDGWFFYNVKGEYRQYLPKTNRGWFASKEPSSSSDLVKSRDSSPLGSPQRSPSRPLDNNKPHIKMSRVLILDLDKYRTSSRSEILWLHLDVSHNPSAAFHLELSWLRLTASLLTPELDKWQRAAETYGLNLVETCVGQSEANSNPFDIPYRMSFSVPPPDVPDLLEKLPRSMQSYQYFERQLLKNLDYLLDIEMDDVFSDKIDVQYTYRRDPCHNPQFLHRSGCASVAVLRDRAGYLFQKNKLFLSRSRARHVSVRNVEELCEELKTICADETKLSEVWDNILTDLKKVVA